MKLCIIIIIVLVFVFAIKDFEIQLLRTSYFRDTEYFDIEFFGVQARDWSGSLLYFQYHGGEFDWDLLFLNSKTSKIRG